MYRIVEYNRLAKCASVLITIIFSVAVTFFFVAVIPDFILFLCIFYIICLFLNIYIFRFRIIYSSSEKCIFLQKTFSKLKKIPLKNITSYRFYKYSYYGKTLVIITTCGKILIPSDCENIDDFHKFLITYRPQYIR